MRRIALMGIWGLCAGVAIGCGGSPEVAREEVADNKIDIAKTTPISETGCLTASGDRFVLTALESGGIAETEMYQLVGQEAALRPHVGREVTITGDAEPAQIAELRESTAAPAPVGTSGEAGVEPQVSTQAQTRLETREMRVVTVTPTGDECAAPGR